MKESFVPPQSSVSKHFHIVFKNTTKGCIKRLLQFPAGQKKRYSCYGGMRMVKQKNIPIFN